MKKALVFLAVLLLAGLAQAATVDMVKNRCSPVGCEQVYMVTGQLAIQDNDNFKIELEQATGKVPNLEYSFGTLVSNPMQTPVYRNECEIVKDKNGHEYQANCVKVLDYYHYEANREIIWQSGFYGKQLEFGKVHFIKASAKFKPTQQFSADVVMTFDGYKYKQFAWWNASWIAKRKITLQTDTIGLSGNITQDHVILVDVNSSLADFWGNVNSDGSDVRFIDAAEGTEYSYYFQDWNYAGQEMLAWVLVTDTFTSASDTEFYMYYGNAGASSGENRILALTNLEEVFHADDFDTGLDVNGARYDFNSVATNASIWEADGAYLGDSGLGINEQYYMSQATLLDVMPSDFTMSFWFKPNTTIDNGIAENHYLFDKRNGAGNDNFINVYFNAGAGTLDSYGRQEDNAHHAVTSQNSWTQDQWYHYILTWNTTWGLVCYIDGSVDGSSPTGTTTQSNGAEEDFWLGADRTQVADFPGWIDEVRVYTIGFSPSDANLMYNIENGSILTFGSQEAGNAGPDVNLTSLEGQIFTVFPFYSYEADGNLTIDFNVLDPDNDRLTLDINYSLTATEGSGTPIYTDLNLSSEQCSQLDWDDTPGECSLDFNIHGIGDNNFYILVSVSDGSQSDFNSHTPSFGIDNNGPVFMSVHPFLNSLIFQDEATMWLNATDSYSGLATCSYTSFVDGIPDVNTTDDFNASGFCPVTENLGTAGSTAFVRYYALTDHAGNTTNLVQDTGLFTRAFSSTVDPENISEQNMGDALTFLVFTALQALGLAAGLIIVFLVVKAVLFRS